MKKLLFLFFLITVSKSFSQQNLKIVGKWKVMQVQTNDFYIDVKKDTIVVSDKIKKWYPTKIGMQNEIASIRSTHYHKVFVFTDENEFFDYLSPTSKTPIFTGKFAFEDKNKLRLEVINIAKIKIKKEAEFHFENNLLHLKMHTETNSPVEYILEKIQQ